MREFQDALEGALGEFAVADVEVTNVGGWQQFSAVLGDPKATGERLAAEIVRVMGDGLTFAIPPRIKHCAYLDGLIPVRCTTFNDLDKRITRLDVICAKQAT